MKPSLIKLQKFFKLEAERGYDNHAVVGGLDRILERWEAEAHAENVADDLIQLVVSRIRDYPKLSPNSRAEVLDGLWRKIQRSEGISPTPLSPTSLKPAQEKPAPSKGVVVTEESRKSSKTDSRKKPKEPISNTRQPPKKRLEDNLSVSFSGDTQVDFEDSSELTDQNIRIEETSPQRRQIQDDLPPVEPAALNASVTVLPGVGPKHAQTLARLGMYTLRDMLYNFPRRYDDYTRLEPINRLWFGQEVTVIGTLQSVNARIIRSGRFQIVEAVINDGTGALRINWFNQSWIGKRLRPGMHIVLSGKIDQYLGRLVMNNPEWEPLEQQQLSTNRIVPVYPLTANITQRWLRKMLNGVVEYWAPRTPDPLPPDLRKSAGLVPIQQALLQIHFPDSWDDLKSARYRLAFDEILMLQLGVIRQKHAWQDRTGRIFQINDGWLSDQVRRIPFELTSAQQRAIQDLRQDLTSGRPMNRLLQGDVGSGKTIVAAMAILMVVQEGAQAALMAPTSILAEQHYRNLLIILSEVSQSPVESQESTIPVSPPPLDPSQIRLMIGATPEAEKQEIRNGLEQGRVKLVIGTHALLEDPVKFADFELAIIDEQHRFGVEQRAILRSKGQNPHLLVMTATPIPRSLALTVYGDLDLSVIDEMPPGREPVNTYAIKPRERERAYGLVRSQVEKGFQAFIIYPLVEESENSEAKAAVEEHARLQKEIFPNLKLGLIHGRLHPDEKDEVMTRFRNQDYQILVATTVVEVGVDIPNATVMLIEGADHFGLAQLHQLRGRVGRGSEQSYCILIPDSDDDLENQRLQVMTETNDGFILAQHDLDQRGPGQFLGTRQAGFSELQLASLTDIQLIENARRHALLIFDKNPELTGTEYAALSAALERFWGNTTKGDIS